jgi:hypothetical protein
MVARNGRAWPLGKSQNQDRHKPKGSPKLMGANGSPFRYGERAEGNSIKRAANAMRISGEQDWLQLAMIVIEELTVRGLARPHAGEDGAQDRARQRGRASCVR